MSVSRCRIDVEGPVIVIGVLGWIHLSKHRVLMSFLGLWDDRYDSEYFSFSRRIKVSHNPCVISDNLLQMCQDTQSQLTRHCTVHCFLDTWLVPLR